MVPPQQSQPASDLQNRSVPPVVFYKGIPCRLTSLSCWSTTTTTYILHTTYYDYILTQSLVDEDGFTLKPASGCRHPAVTLTALAYADDVAITSDSTSGAERTLRRLQFHSETIGLKLNEAKTKVLHVGYESDPEPILTSDGTTIDVCDIYNYLGLPMLSSEVVIRQRFAVAWSAIGKLRPMFHSTAPDALKITFQIGRQNDSSLCIGIPPLNPTTSNILNASHRQMIRAALGINWQYNITNKEVNAKSGILPFSQAIKKRRLHLIGHSLHLQNRSTTPLGSMLQNLSVVFSLRRGQGRTWTLAKDLLNDLNAIDCSINDFINFSSSQFTRLVDSFNSNFYC